MSSIRNDFVYIIDSVTSSLHGRWSCKHQAKVHMSRVKHHWLQKSYSLKIGLHSYITRENKMPANEQSPMENRSPCISSTHLIPNPTLLYTGQGTSGYLLLNFSHSDIFLRRYLYCILVKDLYISITMMLISYQFCCITSFI